MSISARSNQNIYRGDGGGSNQTIDFTHPFLADEVTEARMYVRSRVGSDLLIAKRLSTEPTQWSLSDGSGSFVFAPGDTNVLDEAVYRIDIELQTTTRTETVEWGSLFVYGDVATDAAGDDPPSLLFYVTTEQKAALDAGILPTNRNLTADLTLEDGQCLVLTEYINANGYDITLNGDANMEVL